MVGGCKGKKEPGAGMDSSLGLKKVYKDGGRLQGQEGAGCGHGLEPGPQEGVQGWWAAARARRSRVRAWTRAWASRRCTRMVGGCKGKKEPGAGMDSSLGLKKVYKD